jgi:hypothetical protein
LEQAAKSLVLFVQHEFLRAGEQGKVLNDRVVRDERRFATVRKMLAEGSKVMIGPFG